MSIFHFSLVMWVNKSILLEYLRIDGCIATEAITQIDYLKVNLKSIQL